MKKLCLSPLAIILLALSSAHAALRFGLGDAVAERSAELINKAGNASVVGDAVAAHLPSCVSGAIYDTAPTHLSMIGGIDPLGHVQPPGHTLPSDHIYFYASTTSVVTPPVYAPGLIHITNVVTSEYLSASPVYTDYSLYFYACRDVKSYFFHVRTLSSALSAQIGSSNPSCSTHSTGGVTYRRCDTDTNIVVQSGDLLGYAATNGAFDFGSYDYRIPPLAFISPHRQYSDRRYTVCPIDYFTTSPQAAMQALLGRFDGGYRRTAAPICGKILYDIAGTARGDWYHVGSPDTPEDPHLALIENNVYAPQQTISYGTSLPGQTANFYTFTPTSSGLVNRDFSQVTSDGNIYCYDTFYDPVGQAIGGGPTFIIQMTNATTIKIERQSATSCGSGPWSFTSSAATFQR